MHCYSQRSSWRCRRKADFSTLQRLNHLDLMILCIVIFLNFLLTNRDYQPIWSKGRKKNEENRSRCLDNLVKDERTGCRWFLSLILRFKKFKIYITFQVGYNIEFPIALNLGFRISQDYILRILLIFSLCCFTFERFFFSIVIFLFLLVRLRSSSRPRCVSSIYKNLGMKTDILEFEGIAFRTFEWELGRLKKLQLFGLVMYIEWYSIGNFLE